MADQTAFQKLATQLLKATQQGKVQWSETADEEMFRATFKEAAIRVVKRMDFEGDPRDGYSYGIIVTVQSPFGTGNG